MSSPADEDRTDPNPNLQRYLKADGKFDRLVAPLVASPWTLAIFCLWTFLMVLLGAWIAK